MAKTLASQAKDGGSIPLARSLRWFDERPVLGDACLALLLLVGFVLPGDLAAEPTRRVDLAVSVALLACVPFRRRAPVAMFAAVSVMCLAADRVARPAVAGDVVALIAVYTVVAYGPGTPVGVAATACTAVGALLGAAALGAAGRGVTFLATAATTVELGLLAATLGRVAARAPRAARGAGGAQPAARASSATSRPRSARSSAPGSRASCTTSWRTRSR